MEERDTSNSKGVASTLVNSVCACVCVLGYTGLGDTPLWGSVLQTDGKEAVVWRPENSSVRGWREATIYLGRIPGPFHIQLHSRHSEVKQGDVSVDHMEFLDCALPGKNKWKKVIHILFCTFTQEELEQPDVLFFYCIKAIRPTEP